MAKKKVSEAMFTALHRAAADMEHEFPFIRFYDMKKVSDIYNVQASHTGKSFGSIFGLEGIPGVEVSYKLSISGFGPVKKMQKTIVSVFTVNDIPSNAYEMLGETIFGAGWRDIKEGRRFR